MPGTQGIELLADGKTLKLKFNEEIDRINFANADLKLFVDGQQSAATFRHDLTQLDPADTSNSTLLISLSDAHSFQKGQSLLLTYADTTPNDATGITDLAGNPANAFAQQVTNNSAIDTNPPSISSTTAIDDAGSTFSITFSELLAQTDAQINEFKDAFSVAIDGQTIDAANFTLSIEVK